MAWLRHWGSRMMFVRLLVCVLAFSVVCVAQAQPIKGDVRLVSEEWLDYTNADGSGLAWDIMREVFKPLAGEVKFSIVPYTRSVGLVQRGEADAWMGAYRNEVVQGVIYPKNHYDQDQICALTLAERVEPTLETLGNFRLVWMRDYKYDRYLPNVQHYREILKRGGILGMLDYNHADAFLDAQPEIEQVLSDTDHPEKYTMTCLQKLPNYPGFTDSPRGRALAEFYDQRIDELRKNGTLQSIFKRWDWPYPFD